MQPTKFQPQQLQEIVQALGRLCGIWRVRGLLPNIQHSWGRIAARSCPVFFIQNIEDLLEQVNNLWGFQFDRGVQFNSWRVYFLDLLIARWFRDTPSIGNLHIYGLLWLVFFPHPPSTGHLQFQHVQESHDFYGAFLAVMGLPLKIVGWYGFHGKSQRKIDDLGH